MPSRARTAKEHDVERVAGVLYAAAPERSREAYERAVRARIAERDGGALIAGDATISWALDGGALFLYDLVGEGEDLAAVVRLAMSIAHRRSAAVVAAALYDDEPMLARMEALGFSHDWSEAEASNGRVRRLVGLVRSLGSAS